MATIDARTFATRDAAEQHYLSLVDNAAAEARKINPVQAEVYKEKVAQAKAGGGPLLLAEAQALGCQESVVRSAVLRNHALWDARVKDVEVKRVKCKADIRTADTAYLMHCAYKKFKESI